MTRALPTLVCLVILLATGVYSLYQVTQQTPLFNASLRIGEPWYTEVGSNLYHPAEYALEKSQSYLAQARRNDAKTQDNLERAVEAAQVSLQARPNSGYAMTALGTAYAALSQTQNAREVFLQTYDVAPYHRNISLQRLQILQAYWDDLTPTQQDLVLRDIRNLQSVDSWRLKHLARAIPKVQTLMDLPRTQEISLE